MRKQFAIGMLVALICVGAMAAVNGVFANINASGFINSTSGFRYNTAAPANHILLGDGTNYVDATTLPSATLPTVGTAGTCTYPASVVVDAQGRVTSCTSGTTPRVLATLTFTGCTVAPDGGSVWDCNSSASWGTTLPNNTYALVCTIDQGSFVLNNLSTVTFYKGAKTTTGFSYGLAGDHSGSNGFAPSIDCLAVQ